MHKCNIAWDPKHVLPGCLQLLAGMGLCLCLTWAFLGGFLESARIHGQRITCAFSCSARQSTLPSAESSEVMLPLFLQPVSEKASKMLRGRAYAPA